MLVYYISNTNSLACGFNDYRQGWKRCPDPADASKPTIGNFTAAPGSRYLAIAQSRKVSNNSAFVIYQPSNGGVGFISVNSDVNTSLSYSDNARKIIDTIPDLRISAPLAVSSHRSDTEMVFANENGDWIYASDFSNKSDGVGDVAIFHLMKGMHIMFDLRLYDPS